MESTILSQINKLVNYISDETEKRNITLLLELLMIFYKNINPRILKLLGNQDKNEINSFDCKDFKILLDNVLKN